MRIYFHIVGFFRVLHKYLGTQEWVKRVNSTFINGAQVANHVDNHQPVG